VIVVDPLGSFALAVVAIALVGIARNARWASAAAFAAAATLGALAIDAAEGMYTVAFDATDLNMHLASGAALGALGALAAAITMRRSNVGMIRNAA
jgi:hypothetical protein